MSASTCRLLNSSGQGPVVIVGMVVSVNAARREARIGAVSCHAKMIIASQWLEFRRPGSDTPLRCRVAQARQSERGVQVTLVPGVPRETVATLKGASVMVRGDAPQGSATDYDRDRLLGSDVRDETDVLIGRVSDFYETPANDIVEITRPNGATCLLPLIEAVIVGFDADRGALVVRDMASHVVNDED
jgi:ribosomal 30S subunit maturation factor RimM